MRGINRFSGFFGLGLGEFFLILIDDKTMSHDRLVRGDATIGDAKHERALEPAAMLVGGLEV